MAVGILGILDVAGVDVADPAYPALAVAITGVMLLVGAFYGRAGGLILLGLLTTVGLVGATATARWTGTTNRRTRPTPPPTVEDSYDFNAGEMVLDLSQVSDIEELDGRTIDIDGGHRPDRGHRARRRRRRDHAATSTVRDTSRLFGEEDGGIDNRVTREHDGGVGATHHHHRRRPRRRRDLRDQRMRT